jgi:anti-anti-sigma factor
MRYMTLEIQSRLCGRVHVVECKGRLVAGAEIEALESALSQDLRRDSQQVVLEAGGLSRVDSSGLGFLVRFTVNLRKRGGDMRLAVPPPFLTSLLKLTKVSSILATFPTEDEAILSFLKQSAAVLPASGTQGRVLIVDPSGDFCAFVRAVLGQHGFEVESVSLSRDARVLLQVTRVDCVLVGPNLAQPTPHTLASSLRAIAPRSRVVQLGPELLRADAHEGAELLLAAMDPAARPV